MESLLLSFYNLSKASINQKTVSEQLKISQKHLARSLKRWQAEQFLTYTSGRGRGHMTEIDWQLNIDDHYFQQVTSLFSTEPLDEVVHYLTWDWSETSKQSLLLQANQLLGIDRKDNDRLIIKKRYAPLTLNPLAANDINSFNVLSNLYDTLVEFKEGRYHYQLAHHIHVTETEAVIYLRKNIRFHDGQLLTALDVSDCLKTAKSSSYMHGLLDPLHSIETINNYQLKLSFTDCPYILDILSTLNLSIYKVADESYIGTGPFYIHKNTDTHSILKAFDNYYGLRPFLDEVEMIYIPDQKHDEFSLLAGDQLTAHTVTDGFYYMLSLRDNRLTQAQRETTHYIMQTYLRQTSERKNIAKAAPTILKQSRYFSRTPELTSGFTVRLVYPSYIRKLMNDVRQLLKRHHIEVELIPVTIDEAIHSRLDYSADYYLHGAFLNGAEHYEYFSLLFQHKAMQHHLPAQYPALKDIFESYITSPTATWSRRHIIVDRALEKRHLLIPLFNNQKTLYVPQKLHSARIVLHGFYNWDEVYIE
ncbi:ABC transporter substrate-binding protein [Macrococcus equipercicus]|uniref:SgrR family transcriptional regulator n=1 Tax=Macrococcus equipercicus TaxID=69967 RepID=A0A9Q9BSK7_9STAP|nr:ABC transporter substrate-binding protein [Macrococcus equipercicus]UTH13449.1 SgrR family transcriptional regulator [Macrococcus equipercicus]